MEVETKQLPDSDFSLDLAKRREAQEDNKENACKNANKQKQKQQKQKER